MSKKSHDRSPDKKGFSVALPKVLLAEIQRIADRTALILRHRGAAGTLHNSYRGLGVTQAQGVEFFAIVPDPCPQPIRPASLLRGIVARPVAP